MCNTTSYIEARTHISRLQVEIRGGWTGGDLVVERGPRGKNFTSRPSKSEGHDVSGWWFGTFFMVSLWWNEWLIMVSNWNNHISGWWFGTWILFSIIYMGCHPSHWLSYFWRWLKPPTRFTIYYRIWPYIMQNRTVAILFIIGGGLQNVYKKWFKREHSIFHGFFTLWYIYIYTQCIYICI